MNVIAHNIVAMNAQRQYGINAKSKSKNAEKLSSGYKINRAADDAAGLGISEKMRRQIRGLTQASSNSEDGISYCQVADGALDEVQDMLQRMTELSIKSANGTNSSSDREAINKEMQQLKAEMDRIFSTTKFNEKYIWTPPEAQKILIDSIERTDTKSEPLVTINYSYQNITVNNDICYSVPTDASDIVLSANEEGITVSWQGYNGNTYKSNVVPWDEKLPGSHSFKLSDYMDYDAYPDAKGIDFKYSYNISKLNPEEVKLEDVISYMNGRKINASEYNSVSTTALKVDSSKSAIASFGASISYKAQIVAESGSTNKDFENPDKDFIVFESMNNPALGGVDDDSEISFRFKMEGIGYVKTKVSGAYYTGNIVNPSDMSDRTGEHIWWEEDYRYNSSTKKYDIPYKSTLQKNASPDNGSFTAIAESILNSGDRSLFNSTASNGGHYYVSFDLIPENPFVMADGTTSSDRIGTLSMTISVSKNSAPTKADMVAAVRTALSNTKGVDIYANKSNATIGLSASSATSPKKITKTTKYIDNIYEEIEQNLINVPIHAGADATSNNRINIEYETLSVDKLGLLNANVRTEQSALDCIDMIGNALAKVSAQRSTFGAYQNRLEHTIKNLDNVVENTTASESVIRDTDMAKEMVEYSRQNILAQVGESLMSQANQSSQSVIDLLKQ